jgi:hypothetical protein
MVVALEAGVERVLDAHGAVPGELDAFDAYFQRAAILERLLVRRSAGSASRWSKRRVSSWPIRVTFLSKNEDAPIWSAWWCE